MPDAPVNPHCPEPQKRRRGRGDDGIRWDEANRGYVGAISLGAKIGGNRNRPSAAIVPAIRGGATVMDDVFGDEDN